MDFARVSENGRRRCGSVIRTAAAVTHIPVRPLLKVVQNPGILMLSLRKTNGSGTDGICDCPERIQNNTITTKFTETEKAAHAAVEYTLTPYLLSITE